MEHRSGLDQNEKELRYQEAGSWKTGQIADASGVLRNDIIIKTLRAAREVEDIRKSFESKRRIPDKAA